jgi:glucosamine-6-phosphate deaminase
MQATASGRLPGVHGASMASALEAAKTLARTAPPRVAGGRETTMKLIICDRSTEPGDRLAETLAEAIAANPRLKLGLSAGRTSIRAYGELVRRFHEKGGFSFRHITAFGTDEYVGLPAEDHRSTRYLMNFHLFRQVDIPREQTFVPRGDAQNLEAECKAWDMLIEARGGLDLVVLGLGHNGHIGLNEPGSSPKSRMRVVELTSSTLAALSDGSRFRNIDDTPTNAITMGLATILEAKQVLLIATGLGKAEALHRMVEGRSGPSVPASLLLSHPRLSIFADADSASRLDPQLVREALT